ncbi:hypothetical protein Patl1_05157 [Pistacia atlantica]|uniref:Uncharacterized protein n=1 Tax=Pistacia atlantica TaxID=434234 RepID=A0ACC1BU62_9ROSI|nr:hypothetical protein Patl1_05157 [Pistacia atlantica]
MFIKRRQGSLEAATLTEAADGKFVAAMNNYWTLIELLLLCTEQFFGKSEESKYELVL